VSLGVTLELKSLMNLVTGLTPSTATGGTTHPREEQLLPLMVVAGAAGESKGTRDFNYKIRGKMISAFRFGELVTGQIALLRRPHQGKLSRSSIGIEFVQFRVVEL
jgi:hypothetical protein